VEGQNYLGIYIGKDGATVICLDARGRKTVEGCFSVSLEEHRERNTAADMSELARLIAEGCAERELGFSEVAVALDCSMFMQHSVHSEFNDARQIAQTVRFDTEEALSTDISDVAVAFEISSTGETGSELNVFTAPREVLSAVLLSLQSHDIDPITAEPDINSLSRFILEKASTPEDSNCLFSVLSRTRGYFVGCAKSLDAPAKRTFLIHPAQNRFDLLVRQIPPTVALLAKDEPVKNLRVFDRAGSVDRHRLRDMLGFEAAEFDLVGSVVSDPTALSDCDDAVEFAVAYGAALALSQKSQPVNFRDDFMPYQGRKLRLQKTVKFLSVSVTILLIALGTYVTALWLQMNNYDSRLDDNFGSIYSAVMGGGKLPRSMKTGVRSLGSELRRTRDITITGGRDEQSVLGKLTLVLEAFNKSSNRTGLNIDSVSITDKSIVVAGSTSNRGNTLKLRNALKAMKLGNVHENVDRDPTGRDNFKLTVLPEKK
jgi:hypothetical protein